MKNSIRNTEIIPFLFAFVTIIVIFGLMIEGSRRANEDYLANQIKERQSSVENIRNSKEEIIKTTIRASGDVDYPQGITVVSTRRVGRYSYLICLEGKKEDVAKFLESFYGLKGK